MWSSQTWPHTEYNYASIIWPWRHVFSFWCSLVNSLGVFSSTLLFSLPNRGPVLWHSDPSHSWDHVIPQRGDGTSNKAKESLSIAKNIASVHSSPLYSDVKVHLETFWAPFLRAADLNVPPWATPFKGLMGKKRFHRITSISQEHTAGLPTQSCCFRPEVDKNLNYTLRLRKNTHSNLTVGNVFTYLLSVDRLWATSGACFNCR